MKNKFLNHIILIAFIAILFTGCKKILHHYKDEYVYMSDEMKSYIMQPVGSWWVYQDSVSGDIDTVKLLSQENDYYYSPEEEYLLVEYLRNNFYSSINGEYSYYTNIEECRNADSLLYFIEYGEGPGATYFQDFKHEHNICLEDYVFYETIKINNICYNNTIQFFPHIWSKNIGLIQLKYVSYILDDNFINIIDTIEVNWQLINYSLSK